jgi:hypothetical protein
VKWKEEGYHVRKIDMDKEHGEHGIRILVPKFPKFYKKPNRRRPESQEGAEPEERREDEYKVQEVDFITRSFKIGTVFDVTHLMFLLI